MNALATAFAVINRKGITLLMFRPLPGMSLLHDLNRIPPNSISVVVTGSPELKLVATLLLVGPFSRTVLFYADAERTCIAGCDRYFTIKAASDSWQLVR